MNKPLYVGVDICSKHLDIQHGEIYKRIVFNEQVALKYFLALQSQQEIQLVFEATGTLSKQLIEWINGIIPFSCHNPLRIRQFAMGCNILAKNDRIDAKVLAYYGVNQQPPANTVLSKSQLKAKSLESLLSFYTHQKAKAKCRLSAATDEFEIELLEKTIDEFIQKEQQLEDCLKQLIEESPLLSKICNALVKVKGIAIKSAMRIVINLPEIGSINRKRIVSLTGLCRYCWESGNKSGTKAIRTGRTRVRSALYICCVVAVRCNDEIKTFYQRLLAAGKAKKVALVACARKMLIHINHIAAQIYKEQQTKIAG